MGRILRFYVIREIALPTILSLMTITFILLMGRVFELINLLMQPGVHVSQVGEVLLAFLPAMLLFAVPMSLLIGVLVGVGRLTLDREVLAMRASGVNLFSVFAPTVVLAGIISLILMALSAQAIPAMLKNGMRQLVELQIAVVNTLEPGRFHDKLPGGKDNDLVLYFRERDPQTQEMKGVTLKLEEEVKEDTEASEKPAPGAPKDMADLATVQAAINKKADEELNQAASQPNTILGQAARERLSGGAPLVSAPKKESAETTASERKVKLMMVYAASGAITSKVIDDPVAAAKGDDERRTQIQLHLKKGSIHQLDPDPARRDYLVINFDETTKTLVQEAMLDKQHRALSNAQLRQVWHDKEVKDEKRAKAHRELVERHTITLASLVFVLLGVPLAIWIKPSGKSWGILLAISLMLVYYILMKMGLTMVESEKPFGVFVAFLPNILLLLMGAGLWRQSLRS